MSSSTDDYDYLLPLSAIAQSPAEPRDSSKLLHMDVGGQITDHIFKELPTLLRAGDLLVANHTKVRAARLRAKRENGGNAELLILGKLSGRSYAALVRPTRKLPLNTKVQIANQVNVVIGPLLEGHEMAREITFEGSVDPEELFMSYGEMPVPPYIKRAVKNQSQYQTVYANAEPASAAAPTAGLHFTSRVLAALQAKQINWTTVNLEVGLGTFTTIRTSSIDDHQMHWENYELSPEVAETVARTRNRGGRVIAVGTTSARVLETCATTEGNVKAQKGKTNLFLRPGSKFTAVDGLLTNFHQPRSSLLVLLASFIGQEEWKAAYDHALDSNYRFLSFGDCMLVWRSQQTVFKILIP